jgi:hypothetical protein
MGFRHVEWDKLESCFVSNYLNLIDTPGLVNGIEKYSPDLIRQRSSSPKIQGWRPLKRDSPNVKYT